MTRQSIGVAYRHSGNKDKVGSRDPSHELWGLKDSPSFAALCCQEFPSHKSSCTEQLTRRSEFQLLILDCKRVVACCSDETFQSEGDYHAGRATAAALKCEGGNPQ